MISEPIVLGAYNCPQTHRLCDWLERQGQSYSYVEHQKDEQIALPKFSTELGYRVGCSPDEAAGLIGLEREAKQAEYDVVIVGAGPAGLSAAIHCAAEGLSTLVVEAYAIGGQMSNSQRIENYAGFPEGINGAKLAQLMSEQAQRLGAEILVARSVSKLEKEADGWKLQLDNSGFVWAKVVILALGAQFRTIDISGEEHFLGAGVYYGLTDKDVENCGEQVVVIGGGNSAGQAAIAFANRAKQVTLVVRGDSLSHDMSSYLVKEVTEHPSIAVVIQAQVEAVEGHESLNEVTIKLSDGSEQRLECSAVFVFAGNAPETNWLSTEINRDKGGYIRALDFEVLDNSASRTDARLGWPIADGSLLAIGDVRSGSTKRVAVAAADGAEAAAKAWKIIHKKD